MKYYNVTGTQRKLTYPNSKAPIIIGEKHGIMLEEMIDTFLPISGI